MELLEKQKRRVLKHDVQQALLKQGVFDSCRENEDLGSDRIPSRNTQLQMYAAT